MSEDMPGERAGGVSQSASVQHRPEVECSLRRNSRMPQSCAGLLAVARLDLKSHLDEHACFKSRLLLRSCWALDKRI